MQFYFFLNQALDYGNKLSYYETMGLRRTSTHIKLLNKHNGRCLKKFVSCWEGKPISLPHVKPPALQATSELPKRNIMASRISFVTKGGTDWDKSNCIRNHVITYKWHRLQITAPDILEWYRKIYNGFPPFSWFFVL